MFSWIEPWSRPGIGNHVCQTRSGPIPIGRARPSLVAPAMPWSSTWCSHHPHRGVPRRDPSSSRRPGVVAWGFPASDPTIAIPRSASGWSRAIRSDGGATIFVWLLTFARCGHRDTAAVGLSRFTDLARWSRRACGFMLRARSFTSLFLPAAARVRLSPRWAQGARRGRPWGVAALGRRDGATPSIHVAGRPTSACPPCRYDVRVLEKSYRGSSHVRAKRGIARKAVA